MLIAAAEVSVPKSPGGGGNAGVPGGGGRGPAGWGPRGPGGGGGAAGGGGWGARAARRRGRGGGRAGGAAGRGPGRGGRGGGGGGGGGGRVSAPARPGGAARKFKSVPYWDDECSRLVSERNIARNKANKTRLLDDCIEYRRLKGVAQAALKTKARNHWQDYCDTLQDNSKLASVWRMAKSMNGQKTCSEIPSLESNGQIANSSQDKANMLADYYEKQSSDENFSPAFRLHRATCEARPDFAAADPGAGANDEFNKDLTREELTAAIKACKKASALGPDKIQYEIIQHLPPCMIDILLQLYNLIWKTGQIPSTWKHAEILPFIKPDKKKSEPASYRPISLTSALCKCLERIVNDRLAWHMEDKKLLNAAQTGFRKNLSTTDQLIKLQNILVNKMRRGGAVLGVFLDLEKASDMLWNNGLLNKLKKMKINGRMFNFIQDFVKERTFHVKVKDSVSTTRRLQNGTPQGSVISPTLFLIMINDMSTESSDVDLSLFADDSATFAHGKEIRELRNKMQTSLDAIQAWADRWGFQM